VMIGQEDMVKMSAGDVATLVDDQPLAIPEQGQGIREHTTRSQPLAPGELRQSLETRPRPRTPETNPLSGLEHLGYVTPQKHHHTVPTHPEDEAAGNCFNVDLDQQLLGGSAGGDSVPDVPLHNANLLEAHPDRAVGER
jgi:hypothetical protein